MLLDSDFECKKCGSDRNALIQKIAMSLGYIAFLLYRQSQTKIIYQDKPKLKIVRD